MDNFSTLTPKLPIFFILKYLMIYFGTIEALNILEY
jgi:hypothetical protein